MDKQAATKEAFVLSQRTFDAWVNKLAAQFSLFGPVLKKKNQMARNPYDLPAFCREIVKFLKKGGPMVTEEVPEEVAVE